MLCDLFVIVWWSKTGFIGFWDCPKKNIVFQDSKIPSRMANGGMPKFFAHPCESAVSTLDDHNFLVRTPIPAFLDSTKSSLSL